LRSPRELPLWQPQLRTYIISYLGNEYN